MYNINDLVVIKDDPKQIIYKIININDQGVELKGYKHRFILSVSLDKIELAPYNLIQKSDDYDKKYLKHFQQIKHRNKKHLFGRVLHIDGDIDYLRNCEELYKVCGVPVNSIYMKEEEIPLYIEKIIQIITPDIIVITGHDYYKGVNKKDINNYENSKYFGDTIRIIRKYFNNVVIIAGACHSHYEYLMGQGANFATSPGRIETHTFDPAITAIKVATTSQNKLVDFDQFIKYIEGKRDAIGGIETYGKMKYLY